ncbi:MAG: alpha,alpha-trehalose-phosphate synthase (UDP-forming) [Acidimicrobiales bacterium]
MTQLRDHDIELAVRKSSGVSSGPVLADLVVLANRLPVRYAPNAEGGEWLPSPGGLASALTAVLVKNNGLWVGWPGSSEYGEAPPMYDGIQLKSVDISEEEYADFYLGFSNATLWPLYHDAIRYPEFHRSWWQAYQAVNERFARAAAESVAPGGMVWIQDYQLQLVPRMLRRLRPDVRIGFFLHIPFPSAELFMQLPWRRQILEGLLGADLIGFQVHSDATNFARIARRLTSADGTSTHLSFEGHVVKLGAYPISVDCAQITEMVANAAIRARATAIRLELGNPATVLLGVDRLDYTKGIGQRIRAVSELYADGFLVPGEHVMVQIAVPSRESDAHYEDERRSLEQLVSGANGDQGHVGSPVIHYIHQNLAFEELVALYLAADVMLVTPFRDGMNLVAKEYVMCRADMTGRLVLSEFAGAAAELRGAFIVNPHDLDGLKEAICSAVKATAKEAKTRMARMRRHTLRRTVYDWADSFLAALADESD